MQELEFDIAILLPTRSRTTGLTDSVKTLFDNVKNVDRVCLMLGFDDDDKVGIDHFSTNIVPFLENVGAHYKALTFKRMGYAALNRYYNELAKQVEANWYFVWNDDAVMGTKHWDEKIINENGNFALLKVHTHNEHPYSIFPIVPQAWIKETGCLSRHQMIDAELSQLGYMLDLIKIIDINVTHDQSDLTGNQDSTSLEKQRFEGNPTSPQDFHHPDIVYKRLDDCAKLVKLMDSIGVSTEFFKGIMAGTQDPWEKLKLNDINKQMMQFNLKTTENGIVLEPTQ